MYAEVDLVTEQRKNVFRSRWKPWTAPAIPPASSPSHHRGRFEIVPVHLGIETARELKFDPAI